MVTMDYPVKNITFNGETISFLEDWLSTGNKKRRFEIKNGFKRRLDGKWIPMYNVFYNRNIEPRSSRYTNAVNAGVDNGAFFMQSGGNTSSNFKPPINLKTKVNNTPVELTISFNLTSVNSSMVSWEVPNSVTPQFKYTIKINNKVVVSKIDPNARKSNINAKNGDKVEVILEDILGREKSQFIEIKESKTSLKNGVYKIFSGNSNLVLNATGNNITITDDINSKYQQWEVSKIDNDVYKIINLGNKKSIDAYSKDKVSFYQYHGGANQRWKVTSIDGNTFKIIDSKNSRSLDVAGNNITNGSKIILYNFHGGANQKFKFIQVIEIKESKTSLKNGVYKIFSGNSNLVLNATGNNITITDDINSKYQQWEVSKIDNDVYKIINLGNKKSIDAYSKDKVSFYQYHGGANQRWKVTSIDGNTFKIIDSKNSRSLDVAGNNITNGSKIILYNFHGGANQKFKFIQVNEIKESKTSLKNGVYKIFSGNSNLVLNATGNNITITDDINSKYQQWEVSKIDNDVYKIINLGNKKSIDAYSKDKVSFYQYHGGANQRWKVTSIDGNTFKIIDSKNSRSLDVAGNNITKGSKIILYNFHGGANQKFKFTPVNGILSTKTFNKFLENNSISIKIYPNPASNVLYIEVSNFEGKKHIEIYSDKGIYMNSKSINAKSRKVEFNVSSYPKGVYFIKVGEYSQKVIIK